MDAYTAPLYETPDAAKAAGVTQKILQTWLDRHIIEPTLPAHGSGYVHRFSRNRVMQIAIAFRLWGTGITPREAVDAALTFSDEGGEGRQPGRLFPTGRTVLVIRGSDMAAVVNVPDGETIEDLVSTGDDALVSVDLNRLVESVVPNLVERRYLPTTFRRQGERMAEAERNLARMTAHLDAAGA